MANYKYKYLIKIADFKLLYEAINNGKIKLSGIFEAHPSISPDEFYFKTDMPKEKVLKKAKGLLTIIDEINSNQLEFEGFIQQASDK